LAKLRDNLRKLKYYRDIKLLFRIFLLSFKVSLFPSRYLRLLANSKPKTKKSGETKRIIKYVSLCLFIRRRLGLSYSCLTRSILICHVLRKKGIDARVSFGVKRKELSGRGHCWVSVGKDILGSPLDYETIFSYPHRDF